jgi:hypothetical protein
VQAGADSTFWSGTGSASVDTGALTVVGGLGVSENVYAGGEIHILSETPSTLTTDGALTVAGGAGVGGALNVALDSKFWSETPVTDSTTAALVVSGGLGVVGGAIVGGDAHVLSLTDSASIADGALVVDGGLGVALKSNFGGAVNIADASAATETGIGALVVAGGIAAGDGLWVDSGVVHFGDLTNTIDGTDGAVVVAGGMGVGLDLTVLGNITTSGGILQGPLGMGDIVADATVAALTADTIDGLVVASYNEVVADPAGMSPPPADKIVSPSILRSLLDAPYKIGSVASAPEIHVVDLYADSLAGGNIKATLSDISTGSSGRLVTSDVLHDWVLAPNLTLGGTTAADASIATLKLNSMDTTSGVLVTGAAISASAENLLVTPKALVDFLTAPTAIGGATRANGSFDALAFTSLDSANLATSDDLAAGTSTTKVVTPSAVGSLFASPPAIGSTKANTGTFTTLTADSIIGPIGTTDNATKNDAYFKTINVQAIAGDVIATSSDIYDGTSSSLLVTPAALQTFFGSPYAIGPA